MPLRPELYRRLTDRLGEVRIAHEGEEMAATVERDALTERPRLVVSNPGEYYCVDCPFCNDHRHRLWINHMWGYFHPEIKSRLMWPACCYNERCLEYANNRKQLDDMVYSDIMNGRIPGDVVQPGQKLPPILKVKPAGLIYQLTQLDRDHPANDYLRSRGFDPEMLSRHLEVGYCMVADREFPLAADRIIIPVLLNNQLVGWQARYIGDPPGKYIPKYLTMTGMKKSHVLYNYDIARNYPFCVVVEGVADVWRIGPAGVALFGHDPSAIQRTLLATTWKDGVVVILLDGDEDAIAAAQTLYNQLKGLVRQRVLVQLPEGLDPGDMVVDELWTLIYQAAHVQGVDLPQMMAAAQASA